jgi:hypothetical protein
MYIIYVLVTKLHDKTTRKSQNGELGKPHPVGLAVSSAPIGQPHVGTPTPIGAYHRWFND